MSNFNTFHPELVPGETFYFNCKDSKEVRRLVEKNLKPKFVSVRFGVNAFTPKGEEVKGFVPVFIVKSKKT